MFRATTQPSSCSLEASSKKKAFSVFSLRGLVTTVAAFFVFAPVVLAVCAPNFVPIQRTSVSASFTARDLSQKNRVSPPSASPRLTSHCVLLDLLQFSDGILPSHASILQRSWTPASGRSQVRNENSNKKYFYTLSLDLSDSYRYKSPTLFDQRVLLRV